MPLVKRYRWIKIEVDHEGGVSACVPGFDPASPEEYGHGEGQERLLDLDQPFATKEEAEAYLSKWCQASDWYVDTTNFVLQEVYSFYK